jgi:hypothetical protein
MQYCSSMCHFVACVLCAGKCETPIYFLPSCMLHVRSIWTFLVIWVPKRSPMTYRKSTCAKNKSMNWKRAYTGLLHREDIIKCNQCIAPPTVAVTNGNQLLYPRLRFLLTDWRLEWRFKQINNFYISTHSILKIPIFQNCYFFRYLSTGGYETLQIYLWSLINRTIVGIMFIYLFIRSPAVFIGPKIKNRNCTTLIIWIWTRKFIEVSSLHESVPLAMMQFQIKNRQQCSLNRRDGRNRPRCGSRTPTSYKKLILSKLRS